MGSKQMTLGELLDVNAWIQASPDHLTVDTPYVSVSSSAIRALVDRDRLVFEFRAFQL